MGCRVSICERNVMNHAPTAHAILFLNTKIKYISKCQRVAMRQRRGVIHHVPPRKQRVYNK